MFVVFGFTKKRASPPFYCAKRKQKRKKKHDLGQENSGQKKNIEKDSL